MKTPKSKRQLSQELDQEIRAYVREGGQVEHVPRGLSGNSDNENLFKNKTVFEPAKSHTLLADVVETLEERKRESKHSTNKKERRQGPQKRLIKDDFGEPLRWVWEE